MVDAVQAPLGAHEARSFTDGLSNCVSWLKCGSPAALWTLNLSAQGHRDWYVPSMAELFLVAANLADCLSPNIYWSSTRSDRDRVWCLDLSKGVATLEHAMSAEAQILPVRRAWWPEQVSHESACTRRLADRPGMGLHEIDPMMPMLAGSFVLANAELLLWVVRAAAYAPGFVWTYGLLQVMDITEQVSLLLSWAWGAALLGSRVLVARGDIPLQFLTPKALYGRW
jgi:hypothetical protein